MGIQFESRVAVTDEIIGLRNERWGAAAPPGFTFSPDLLGVGFFDFSAIVDRAAGVFERFNPLTTVTHNARRVLIDRAVEHRDAIVQSLTAEDLTPFDLENAAYKQIDQACADPDFRTQRAGPGGMHFITADNIEHSLKWKCWFVGWC